MKRDSTAIEQAKEALAECEANLLARSDVVATAVGLRSVGGRSTEELCVKAFVIRKRPADQLPSDACLPSFVKVRGNARVPVDVEEMAPPCFPPRNACLQTEAGCRYYQVRSMELGQGARPAVGGISAAHFQFTHGTLGAAVRDRADPNIYYILSANHVLARTNLGRGGDCILQPAPADGGRFPRDVLGWLCRYVPVDFRPGTSNLADAAVACVQPGDVERHIQWIGTPRGVRRRDGIHLGETVQKTGRTTGHTLGTVLGIHATVKLTHSFVAGALFREQLLITGLCADGDSGALVLDLDSNAVGLLFGASASHSVVSYIDRVEDLLGVVVADTVV